MPVTLALNYTHDASVCVLDENSRIRFYSKEERFSRRKRDSVPYFSLRAAWRAGYLEDVERALVVNWLGFRRDDGYGGYFRRLLARMAPGVEVEQGEGEHHLLHALCAFGGSPFAEALVVVVDAAGATLDGNGAEEKESVFVFSGRAQTSWRRLFLHASDAVPRDLAEELQVGGPGICDEYDAVTRHLGFDVLDGGKTMGLAAYGCAERARPLAGHVADGAFERSTVQPYADLAAAAQQRAAARTQELIETWVERTGIRDVCLSGGFAQNSVANGIYARALDGVRFWFDPLCDDGGISAGAAFSMGGLPTRGYEDLFFSGLEYEAASAEPLAEDSACIPAELAHRLVDGEVGAIFEGRAEAGNRALGHRSILCDPRRSDGRDAVNQIKRREWFRPFAAAVLAEHAEDWFSAQSIAPFMTSVVDVLPERAPEIPAVTHVDGTCRVQLLAPGSDEPLRRVVEEFHALTGVPLLLNTSFNLCGEPLVETPHDAHRTLAHSELDWIYMPKERLLVGGGPKASGLACR
jgi:carbamoyltransferase